MSVELAHVDFGEDGPPVVILHGLLGSARNWSTIAKRLVPAHRVIAVDLRNHGASPWADDVSYQAMADDVSALLARLDLDAPAVVGHSMGGKVAMRLALDHAEQVGRLVVVDIAPVGYRRSFGPYVEAMRTLDLRPPHRRSDVDDQLRAAVPDAGVRAFLLQNLVSGEQGFSWRVNLDALAAGMDDVMGFPLGAEIPAYEGPTLFIAAGRSDYLRAEHGEEIARLFPNAQHVTIEDAGHWVHAERPQEFLERLLGFLD